MLQFSLWHSLPFSSTTSAAIHFALLPNCSHSKVWSSPKVIHWVRKIVPVLSTSASVSAVCQKYSPLWLHLMPDGLYWDMVRVFVHGPQDFSRQDANPSLLSGSVTPPSAEEKRPSPGTQLVTNSCYTGLEEATEIVFVFHEPRSSCLLDGNGEPALGSLFGNIQELEYTWIREWLGLCDSHVGTCCSLSPITESVFSKQTTFNLVFSLTLTKSSSDCYQCFLKMK